MDRAIHSAVILIFMTAFVSPYSVKFAGKGEHSYELHVLEIEEEMELSHTHIHLQMNSTEPVFFELQRGRTSLLGTIHPITTLDVDLPRTFLDFLSIKNNNSESNDTIVLTISSTKATIGELKIEGLWGKGEQKPTNEISDVKVDYDLDAHSRKTYKIAGLKELFDNDGPIKITFGMPVYFHVFWGKCSLYFPDGPAYDRNLKPEAEAIWKHAQTADVIRSLAESTCPDDQTTDVEVVLTTYGNPAKGQIRIKKSEDVMLRFFLLSILICVIVSPLVHRCLCWNWETFAAVRHQLGSVYPEDLVLIEFGIMEIPNEDSETHPQDEDSETMLNSNVVELVESREASRIQARRMGTESPCEYLV